MTRVRRLVAPALVLMVTACAVGDVGTERRTDEAGPGQERVVAASIPYYDQPRAFEVAVAHSDLFTDIGFWWYSVRPDGGIGLLDDPHTKVDRHMVRTLQREGIRVIPHIANYTGGDWTHENASIVIRDPALRSTHVRNVVDLVVREGYDGIDIDYEGLTDGDREPLVAFLAELGEALDEQGKLLTVSVQPKVSDEGAGAHNRAQDYAAIADAVDRVNLMAYDYSYSGSDPGPVAPLDWVDDVLGYATGQVDPDKIVLGHDLLGYDWDETEGRTATWQDAVELAAANNVEVSWDAESQSPWFRYGAGGHRHEVWFENADSTARKLELVDRYGLGGAFFWRLGGEDPATWSRVESAFR